ncbi:prepilin-type N-terminal cleavage/methylation domain-containing protein [Desulfococcus sp.]|uniref:type IV pilus modification PilV family protein n=1 Tax=Desulfococcus sp. TaxID=2025834 RepID=UPI00359362E2
MRKPADGFTLIEVLTAMMILAISLVTILQLFSGGLRSAAISGEYTRAVFYAREKMEEMLLYDEMRDTALEGDFEDGYGWRAETRYLNPEPDEEAARAGRPESPPETPWPLDLFEITVEVRWREADRERSVTLQTVHAAKRIETEDGA